MKYETLRWLRLVLGLLLVAAIGGQPGGFDLVAQQIQVMGARQWLGLMAGSAIAPGRATAQHLLSKTERSDFRSAAARVHPAPRRRGGLSVACQHPRKNRRGREAAPGMHDVMAAAATASTP